MYNIFKTSHGYNLTFSGTIDEVEMGKWVEESKRQLQNETRKDFVVIIDMKNLQPLKAAARALMAEGQKLYKTKGMTFSAVILNNAEVCSQFKTIAINSGIYKTERYLDYSKYGAKVMSVATDWVMKQIDPDKKGLRTRG